MSAAATTGTRATPRHPNGPPGLALAVTGAALFMVVLDNLVVTTALPSIRNDLGASVEQLGWFVNAYTLTFAVLLLPGAALGDRFGRRRIFQLGLALFTLASGAAALAQGSAELVAARAVQGAGAALVLPLSLTLLSAAFPAERRGVALGIWSGISGLAIALGPLVGGAVVDGISWQWIFWLNVPIGLLVLPSARAYLAESRGPRERLDPVGLLLATVGLLGIVYGIVRGNTDGWSSLTIIATLAGGVLVLALFVAWEARIEAPMLPLRLFRNRAFAVTNVVSISMSFGLFGSIFLLAQFLQTVQGYSAFHAGLRTLPWTLMPMFVAPIAGALSDRIGGRPLMALGLALQSVALGWLAVISAVDVPYSHLVLPFALAGTGMALVFAPVANVVLSSVRPEEQGKASGANNAIREVGGALGVAVLAAVFSSAGSYQHRADVRERARARRVDRRWRARRRRAASPARPPSGRAQAARRLRGRDELAARCELLVRRDAEPPEHAVDDLVRPHARERRRVHVQGERRRGPVMAHAVDVLGVEREAVARREDARPVLCRRRSGDPRPAIPRSRARLRPTGRGRGSPSPGRPANRAASPRCARRATTGGRTGGCDHVARADRRRPAQPPPGRAARSARARASLRASNR